MKRFWQSLSSFTFAILIFSASKLHAEGAVVWELRSYYALMSIQPDQLNETTAATRADWPQHERSTGFGLAFFGTHQSSRLGLGLRFELLTDSETKETVELGLPTSMEYTMGYARLAPLVRYLVYSSERYFLGLSGSTNVLPRFRYTGDLAGERIIEYTAKRASDYTLGLDFGFNMSYVTFGFEGGYQFTRIKKIKNELLNETALNTKGGRLEVDLGGPYFHIGAGFKF